jgi:branched-chain amino acid transport system substrate-binding protein
MKNRVATVLALVLGVAAALASTVSAGSTASATAAASASCSAPALGISAPLTGPAAFLGQEQLSWTQFAAANFNKQFGTKFAVKQGDTQLSASLARTIAQKFVSDGSILGVVGPSTSQAVISSGLLFKRASLAAVSGSATRVSLTNGTIPTFFRVVPNDNVQAPDVANFLKDNLKAKTVVVMDSQDDYSKPLADAIQALLKKAGVTVQRESVAATDTDFSSIVSKTPDDATAIVFATQTASAAGTLSNQLREQGKKAVVFATDGAYQPAQYKPKSGYASVFALDLNLAKGQKALVAQYRKFSKGKSFGAFGPPSYQSAWVLMTAIKTACKDGKVTRAEVLAQVKKTNVPSIIGGVTKFTAKGDVVSPHFFIYKITDGKYSGPVN